MQFYAKYGIIISDVTLCFNLVTSVGKNIIKWRLPGGTLWRTLALTTWWRNWKHSILQWSSMCMIIRSRRLSSSLVQHLQLSFLSPTATTGTRRTGLPTSITRTAVCMSALLISTIRLTFSRILFSMLRRNRSLLACLDKWSPKKKYLSHS